MATVTSAGSGHLRDAHTDSGINGAGLGELLRHARESRGLTLERIARETRIPQRHLEALEHGDLGANPAGFYQRAEIRAYARAVGLDTELAMARLQSAVRPVDPPSASRQVAKPRRSTNPRTYVLLALAVVAAAMGAAALGRAISQPAPTPAVRSSDAPSAAAPVVAAREASPDTAAPSVNQPAPVTSSAVASEAGVQGATPVPESPAPASSVSEIVVTTQPAGARVTVNGIGWGVSPVTIRHMPPGDKRIRVSREGYASQERVLQLGEGQRHTLDIPLDTAP
jgi:cytoskeleton protein RodZ